VIRIGVINLLAIVLYVLPSLSATTDTITQFGVAWTFSGQVEYGQFVNGDYWVVDSGSGVDIINITPGSTADPRPMNGSMINPVDSQSYDGTGNYTAGTNVGIGISTETPLTLNAGESLVSAISNATPFVPNVYTGYLKTAAVLTCLASAPPAGTFRPGYSDPDKKLFNVSQIQTNLLRSLSATTIPNITTQAGYFSRPWLMHIAGDLASRYILPNDNVPDNYYFPQKVIEAALTLHTNTSLEAKMPLLINYLQFCIDVYGVVASGQPGWNSQAGFGYGKKMPILFAGRLFNDTDMLSIGQKSGDYADGYGPVPADYIQFGEDKMTAYITQEWVDCTQGVTCTWNPDQSYNTAYPYTSDMIGMPEWFQYAVIAPQKGDSAWNAEYRSSGSGGVYFAGSALIAYMMNLKTLWNHDVFFDYTDRVEAIADGLDDGWEVQREDVIFGSWGFIGDMWDRYRNVEFGYKQGILRTSGNLAPRTGNGRMRD